MFHRERGEMGIRDKIPDRVPVAQHLLKDGPMLVRRLDDANTWLIEPALHTVDGFLERERALMQPRVGADPEESIEHRPAQPYRTSAAKLSVPPSAGRFMMLREGILGVEKDIRVHQDH